MNNSTNLTNLISKNANSNADYVLYILLAILFIIFLGLVLYCCLYKSDKKKPDETKKKRYLSEEDILSHNEFKSLLNCLKEIYIKNINETHNIVYFVTPSMIEHCENGFFVQPLKS